MNPATQTELDQPRDLQIEPAEILANPHRKLTGKQRRSLWRMHSARHAPKQERVPQGEKTIIKLSTLTMRQLVRRVKQAVRWASHYKHEIERNAKLPRYSVQCQANQDASLVFLKHVRTEIEFRTKSRA
jgi:lysyl-tRNA synthetase class I